MERQRGVELALDEVDQHHADQQHDEGAVGADRPPQAVRLGLTAVDRASGGSTRLSTSRITTTASPSATKSAS